LAVVEGNSKLLGVGVPRVRHDFGNDGGHSLVLRHTLVFTSKLNAP
jgi:hypothetical protein